MINKHSSTVKETDLNLKVDGHTTQLVVLPNQILQKHERPRQVVTAPCIELLILTTKSLSPYWNAMAGQESRSFCSLTLPLQQIIY